MLVDDVRSWQIMAYGNRWWQMMKNDDMKANVNILWHYFEDYDRWFILIDIMSNMKEVNWVFLTDMTDDRWEI